MAMFGNGEYKRFLSMPNRRYDYCIVTNFFEIIKVLEIIYYGFLKHDPVRQIVEVGIYQVNEDKYKAFFRGKVEEIKDPISFVNNIIFENPFFEENILAMHGAVVEVLGKAYLFLGETEAGKTTLASYLINKGFNYMAEDCILIDYEQDVVNPYPNPLYLRNGGVEILENNGVFVPLRYVDYFSFKRYIYIPQNCQNVPQQIGSIFFIKRSMNRNKVSAIKAEDAFFRLIKSTIIQYSLRHPYIREFKRLSTLPCYILEYADLSFVKNAVEEMSG
ncbi:MAG: hypothetical protein HFH85_02785 [Lachnospiraceae bacterium]|nr:hypothetical protein [Lachnospiraceae bacterium]